MTELLAGRRILIVEDEMLVLMQIETELIDLGGEISAVASVADALALLSQQSFDAAIIDVNLGAENSYPIADALAQRGIPFAFSTGYGDLGDRIDLDRRPMLRKPYARAALVAVCQQLLMRPLPAAA